MIKILLFFTLMYSSAIYSQDFEYKYEVCSDSKLLEEHIYDSKTGIYKEINYDRNTFSDTLNLTTEILEAYIPIELNKKTEIYSLLKSSNLKENTFISGSLEKFDYVRFALFFYENGTLINNGSKYLNRENKTEDFDTLLRLVLNVIQSSKEYKSIFYWYGEKK